jgi:hypothetical protein
VPETSDQHWRRLETAWREVEYVQGIILDQVEGGFTVDLGGVVALLPTSQVDILPSPDVTLCLSKIKSEHIRDAIRRGPGGKEYVLPSLRCAIGEHPCPKPSACASHYSSERKISESGADVPRLRQ